MDSILSFMCDIALIYMFFVWEASAGQDMAQWSPPDVRLSTLRGQITKRKYTLKDTRAWDGHAS